MRHAMLNIHDNRRLARIVGALRDAHALNAGKSKQFESVSDVHGAGLGELRVNQDRTRGALLCGESESVAFFQRKHPVSGILLGSNEPRTNPSELPRKTSIPVLGSGHQKQRGLARIVEARSNTDGPDAGSTEQFGRELVSHRGGRFHPLVVNDWAGGG